MDAKIFKDIIGKSEILRLEAKRAFTILLAIGVPLLCVGLGVTIFSLFHFGEDDGPYNILLFIFLFVTLIGFILVIVAVSKKNKYQKNVLALIEASVDKELYTNVKKNRSAGFPLKMLLEPGFFASPDRYNASNYMSAAYGDIRFERADFDLQRREETRDSKGNVQVNYVSYAKGRMFHITFEREFHQRMMVVEKSFLGTPKGKGLEKVETEFLEFNKKFAVYSSDQQFVFYVLTPQIQEKFLELEKKNSGKFYYAVINNEIYLALANNGSYPVPPLNEPLSEGRAMVLAEQFTVPAMIIDTLGIAKNKFKTNAGV